MLVGGRAKYRTFEIITLLVAVKKILKELLILVL